MHLPRALSLADDRPGRFSRHHQGIVGLTESGNWAGTDRAAGPSVGRWRPRPPADHGQYPQIEPKRPSRMVAETSSIAAAVRLARVHPGRFEDP